MPASARSRYTLVIPTYNRPARLRGLLGYLAARRFRYPVRILDSSFAQALSENRATIARTGLEIAHQVYDPAIGVDKVISGIRSVETPYCSFCPDDDILFTSHLEQLLDVLDADPALAAAHGYYVNFDGGEDFHVSDIVYSAPSIAGDDALERIVAQMSNYQATLYAVHRTSVMQSVLSQIHRVNSHLAQELLSSALTLVAGGVLRIPYLHMARSTGPSMAREGWHPHQFLATDPSALFEEYSAYRAVVLEHLAADERCRETYPPDQTARVLDLVHLQYLAATISGPVIDYLIEEALRPDGKPGEIVAGIRRNLIDVGAREPEGMKGLLGQLWRAAADPRRAGRLLGYLGRLVRLASALRFREGLHVSVGRRLGNMEIRRGTRGGKARRYLLAREFLNHDLGDGRRISAPAIRSMIEQLDDYV